MAIRAVARKTCAAVSLKTWYLDFAGIVAE